uniref:Uncharacterized protein n=1 Tax=Zea mays TaxID=4577 RepID=B6T694_MAIZE|nr:hypothetical protein [Zea mays]|eukprot:NP_001143502.1 uncharacterized protein LOC100276181 [Zea mays]
MEDLVSSPSFRSVLSSSSEGQAQSGESSWTDYFVDFMLSEEERKRQADASSYSYCATEDEGGSKYGGDGSNRDEEEEEEEESMVSDAASHAPTTAGATALIPAGRYKELKKLKKKPFGKALDHDGSLEDTASSPVNSPKVSVVSQLELSPKRRCNIRDLTKGVVGIGDDHGGEGMDVCTDATTTEGARLGDQYHTSIAPCAELKDKGICLFPFSVLLHYHGPN